MDINNFVANFAAQFDETDATIFTAETNFKTLAEWSSLIALTIIAMVDESYHVRLKGDDIRQSTTVGDLFRIVENRL